MNSIIHQLTPANISNSSSLASRSKSSSSISARNSWAIRAIKLRAKLEPIGTWIYGPNLYFTLDFTLGHTHDSYDPHFVWKPLFEVSTDFGERPIRPRHWRPQRHLHVLHHLPAPEQPSGSGLDQQNRMHNLGLAICGSPSDLHISSSKSYPKYILSLMSHFGSWFI